MIVIKLSDIVMIHDFRRQGVSIAANILLTSTRSVGFRRLTLSTSVWYL